jgi:hypothetical protein
MDLCRYLLVFLLLLPRFADIVLLDWLDDLIVGRSDVVLERQLQLHQAYILPVPQITDV